MTTIPDLQPLMHPQMYAELLSIAADARDSETYEIERHHLRGDYDRSGRYFGSLDRGERMYAVYTDRSVHHVRTRANLRQLKSAFAEYIAQERLATRRGL